MSSYGCFSNSAYRNDIFTAHNSSVAAPYCVQSEIPFVTKTEFCAFVDGLITRDHNINIVDINVIVPGKVVEIVFNDGNTEKMVCHKDDTFDLRKCCFIAIAKHLYKKEYTQEGIEYMATQLTYQKKYVKIVDKALKEHNKKMKEEEKRVCKEEEEKLIYERQSAKRRKQKERREKRHRDALVNMISDAINQSNLCD